MHPKPLPIAARGGPAYAALCDAIDAIGSADFDTRLLALLNRLCGAEHVALYQLRSDDMRSVGAASLDGSDLGRRRVRLYLGEQHWRRDPSIAEARRRAGARDAALIRIHPRDFPDGALRRQIYRRIGERLLVYGRRGDSLFGLSVLRGAASGDFSDRQAGALCEEANLLLSITAKHADTAFAPRPLASAPLDALDEIEGRVRRLFPDFSGREAQVCARILFGLSAQGIAQELDISEETVATYRKRAYRRLAIASRHELLRQYLRPQ